MHEQGQEGVRLHQTRDLAPGWLARLDAQLHPFRLDGTKIPLLCRCGRELGKLFVDPTHLGEVRLTTVDERANVSVGFSPQRRPPVHLEWTRMPDLGAKLHVIHAECGPKRARYTPEVTMRNLAELFVEVARQGSPHLKFGDNLSA